MSKSTGRPAPKPRRWRWIMGFAAVCLVALVISLALHRSGPTKGSSPFGPRAASSSAPAISQPQVPTTSPSAGANPTDGAIDGESTLPDATLQQIQQVVAGFVGAYYTRRYTDPPNANFDRVAPYLAPGFIGPLPPIASRTSNAGQSFYEYRTVSIASVNGIAYDLASPNRAVVTVTIMQTTSYEGSGTNWYTFTRTLTLVHTHGNWLVAQLAEGVYGP